MWVARLVKRHNEHVLADESKAYVNGFCQTQTADSRPATGWCDAKGVARYFWRFAKLLGRNPKAVSSVL
jgi:hypothetical protein